MSRKLAMAFIAVALVVSSAQTASAGDFVWVRELNRRALADPEGFAASIATRFKIGNAEVQAILGNVDRPADAYMVYRMGELAGFPVDRVLERYRTDKGKGWGALAKSLGIKPGSREFHALKRGHDLYDGGYRERIIARDGRPRKFKSKGGKR